MDAYAALYGMVERKMFADVAAGCPATALGLPQLGQGLFYRLGRLQNVA